MADQGNLAAAYQDFQEYIDQNIQRIRESRKPEIKARAAFLEKFPLDRIKEL